MFPRRRPELLLLFHRPLGPAKVVNRVVEALVELSCGSGKEVGRIFRTKLKLWPLRVICSWCLRLAHLHSVNIQSSLGIGRSLRLREYNGNPSGVVGTGPPVLVVFSESRPPGPHEHRQNMDFLPHLVVETGDPFLQLLELSYIRFSMP